VELETAQSAIVPKLV